MKSDLNKLVSAYETIKDILVRAGFGDEIRWQRSRSINEVSEESFLREAAWVILSSGMRESVVRKRFSAISRAFFGWRSGKMIARHARACRTAALRHFNHKGKIDAIVTIARRVAQVGFNRFWSSLRRELIASLDELPYLGAATARHLAKNLGMPVVKPDRHLNRLASASGHASPNEMCSRIAEAVRDEVAVVDMVLWRYATLDNNLRLFRLRLGCADAGRNPGTA